MPSSALMLYSDSEMTNPARNAPSERDRPALEVRNAVARHRESVLMRKSSRLRVCTTRCNGTGTSLRAARNTSTTRPSPFTVGQRNASPPPSPPAVPARNGTSSIIGTTARSWKMRMDRTMRPWTESISARCCNIFSTMAVEDNATRNPTNTACEGLLPRPKASRPKAAMVSAT